MLICPNTGVALRRTKIKGGHIWYSPVTGGRMLTMAMVRHFLNEHAATEIWMRSENARSNPEKICPSCLRPMRVVLEPGWIGSQEVDVCRSCFLVWLDEGEHDEVPHPKTDLDANVVTIQQRVARLEVAVDQQQVLDEKASFFGEGPDSLFRKILGIAAPVKMEKTSLGHWPLVTMGVVVLMIFISAVLGRSFDYPGVLGLHLRTPAEDFGVRFLTYPWVDVSRWSLLTNAYFLGMFADDLEGDVGHSLALVLLIGFAIVTGLIMLPLGLMGEHVLIGAHGLVGALMAYVMFRFPQMRFAFLIPVVRHVAFAPGTHTFLRSLQWIRLPIWLIPLFYFGYCGASLWLSRGQVHPLVPVASFFTGLLLGYLTQRWLMPAMLIPEKGSEA